MQAAACEAQTVLIAANVDNSTCPRCQLLWWQLRWMAVVVGGQLSRWQLSWLGGSCTGGSCPGGSVLEP